MTPFDGAVDESTLTADIASTPLTQAERGQPLALAPLLEFLAASKAPGTDELEEFASVVREEAWGCRGGPA